MRRALAVVLWLGSWACAEDESTPLPRPATIGPAGGTVALEEARVAIPPGALTTETSIAVARVDHLPPAPAGYSLAGPAFAFTPHGTTFTQPVTINLAYFGSHAKHVVLRLNDESDTEWSIVEGATFVAGTATLMTSTFSIYAVAGELDDEEEDAGVSPFDTGTEPDAVDADLVDADAVDADPVDAAVPDTAELDSGPTDSGADPDAGPSDVGLCDCPTEANVIAQWASGPSDIWVITRLPLPGTSRRIYHYDGAQWLEPSVWYSPSADTSTYAPDMQIIAGRLTGPGTSEVVVEGLDAHGQLAFDGTQVVAQWRDGSSASWFNYDLSEKLWMCQDATITVRTGGERMTVDGAPISLEWPSVLPWPTIQLSAQIAGEIPLFYFASPCLATLVFSYGPYASWTPDRIAIQYQGDATCEAILTDCRNLQPGDTICAHLPYDITLDESKVYALTSSHTWNVLEDASLLGVPCGDTRPYAQTSNGDLYVYTSTSESWDRANSRWPAIMGATLCETSYPEQPLPSCGCP